MFIRRKTFKNAANSRAKSSWFIYTYEFFGVKNIKRMDKKSYYSIFLVFLNISVLAFSTPALSPKFSR